MAREYKAIEQKITSIKDRLVTGVFSVAGNVDGGLDRVWPGAFTTTIAKRGTMIPHLWQHDTHSPPTAIVKNVRELTLADLPVEIRAAFPEATGGAEVQREYLDTPRADEVLTAIRAGSPLQMSFGYDATRYDYEKSTGNYDWERVRNLYEVDLWETSDVLWGMNEATTAGKRMQLADQSDAALTAVKDYITRLRDLADLRAKDGRVLSGANRTRIETAVTALADAQTTLQELLDATDPGKQLALTQRARQEWQERQHELIRLGVKSL